MSPSPTSDPRSASALPDTGERMIPAAEGELSIVFSRHRFAYEYAQRFVGGKSVLDLGCGTGYGAAILARTARSVLGIDQSEEAVVYCRRTVDAPNVEFRRGDASDLRLPREFDVAVSFQVIEHMKDPDRFLEGLSRVVVPGGTIVLTTPNVRGTRAGPPENPFHHSEMGHEEFRRLLSRHFRSVEVLAVALREANPARRLLRKIPVAWIGRRLSRRSVIKKAGNRLLDLTGFRITGTDVETEALDLLAVCVVPPDSP